MAFILDLAPPRFRLLMGYGDQNTSNIIGKYFVTFSYCELGVGRKCLTKIPFQTQGEARVDAVLLEPPAKSRTTHAG